ncbi:MAG: zinc-binding dehydrogenase [Anderseniella sp.]|nr:zinc-binding dehydrogenase [Anderseniella sp.]
MTIPDKMKAFVLTGHGDMDKLVYHTDWPVPVAGKGEVLIKVNACGLNNTDVNTRTAWYSKGVSENTTGGAFDSADDDDATWGGAPITFPRIQGADVCGTVVAGPDSLMGRRVLIETWMRDWNDPLNMAKTGYFGSECDGGFAEYVKIDQRNVHAIDSTLSDAELATFATSWVTAENMLNRANVTDGDIVLIPGASGGVGSALIQLANRRGATTIAMASRSKHDAVAGFEPDAILERAPDNLKKGLRQVIGRDTVSVVADVVGGDYWPQLIDVLDRGGRYTCAGAIAGPMVELDLRTFYLRDLTFTGATIVPPGLFADLVGYIERGEVKSALAATYPLERLHDAQRVFIDKKHTGNIVVTMT